MIDTVKQRIDDVEHWELLTLMVLTGASILLLYTIGLAMVWPLFAALDFGVFVVIGLFVAGVIATVQYWLAMERNRELGRELTKEEAPAIHESAASLAADLGIEKPELRVIEDETPNAFAAGRPSAGIVFFHTGLLATMSDDEVEAILAHESAHLKNRDSMVLVLANAVRRLMRRGTWVAAKIAVYMGVLLALALRQEDETEAEARRRIRRQRILVFGLTAFVSGLVMVFSRALSRYREYVADLTAARAIGDPKPMVSALHTLDDVTEGGRTVANDEAAPLYVINSIEGRLAPLFNTHPDVEKRIDVVESAFDTETESSALATGAVLGRFTRFGLAGAPAIIVGTGVGYVLLAGLELAGVSAFSVFGSGVGLFVGVVVALALIASLVLFPWAMLFADGGTAKLGFAAVVLVLLLLFGGSLPDVPLVRYLDPVAYLGLMVVSGLHLRKVVEEIRAR